METTEEVASDSSLVESDERASEESEEKLSVPTESNEVHQMPTEEITDLHEGPPQEEKDEIDISTVQTSDELLPEVDALGPHVTSAEVHEEVANPVSEGENNDVEEVSELKDENRVEDVTLVFRT